MDDTAKQPASEALSDDEKEPKEETKSCTVATAAVWSTANDDCILFGRGKGCNNHPGNKRMRLVIEGYRDRYQGAGRGGKRKLVYQIYKELIEAGMKFLKQEEGLDGWVEADADEAIKKVGHAMRCPRIRIRNEAVDLGDRSNVASGFSAAVYPHARAHAGQMLLNNSAVIGRDSSIPGLLGLPSMSSAVARAGFLSQSTMEHQEALRVGLGMLGLSDPLLLALGRISMQMDLTSLHAGASSASMGFTAPAMGLNGLSSSALELLIRFERERQLRQAMLSIINLRRNTEQR